MAEAQLTAPRSSRLNWCIRLLGTAFGFVSFGVGGLIFTALIVPYIWLRHQNERARGVALRRAISRAFLMHVNALRAFGVLDYTISDRSRFAVTSTSDRIIVANHPSLMDVVFLVAFVENAVCVVKDSLFRNFYIGFAIRMAGYVSNKDPDTLIVSCKEALERGEKIIIFPEGTRSTPGERARLQRGSAYVALACGIEPTPVRITAKPSSLTKGLPWYSIPPSKMVFHFDVGEPIAVADLQTMERGLAARRLNRRIAQEIFRSSSEEG